MNFFFNIQNTSFSYD